MGCGLIAPDGCRADETRVPREHPGPHRPLRNQISQQYRG